MSNCYPLCTTQRLLTINTAAKNLSPEADGPIGVPGLGVDANKAGHGGNWKEPKNRSLWILVSVKYLCNSMFL